jgi:hypothetical protein
VLRVFEALGLTRLTRHPTNGVIMEATNLTILNFFLLHAGPLSEPALTRVLMASQVRRGFDGVWYARAERAVGCGECICVCGKVWARGARVRWGPPIGSRMLGGNRCVLEGWRFGDTSGSYALQIHIVRSENTCAVSRWKQGYSRRTAYTLRFCVKRSSHREFCFVVWFV